MKQTVKFILQEVQCYLTKYVRIAVDIKITELNKTKPNCSATGVKKIKTADKKEGRASTSRNS